MALLRRGVLVAFLGCWTLNARPSVDPFEFFQPTVTLTADNRRQLDRGEPVARILPAPDRELAVFAAVPVRIESERLVMWVRRIDALKKSAYVLAIHRFSDPPHIEDLAELSLDDDEATEARACRPDHCELNVSPTEAGELGRSESNAATQQAFRRIVLRRAQEYLNGRHLAGLAPLIRHSAFLTEHLPQLAHDLERSPRLATSDVESFLYWSKERLAGKPIIGITDVSIWRGHEPGLPDVIVVGREFFATHYISASLGLTVLVSGDTGSRYLVYMNRSTVDALGGLWGGIVRWFAQRRVKAEAADVLQGLRLRLESGDPPPLQSRSLS